MDQMIVVPPTVKHPGRVRDMFGSPKGRTELKFCRSRPKFCAEHRGNVRFGVAPQKPIIADEQLKFLYEFWQISVFFYWRTTKNLFYSIGFLQFLVGF